MRRWRKGVESEPPQPLHQPGAQSASADSTSAAADIDMVSSASASAAAAGQSSTSLASASVSVSMDNSMSAANPGGSMLGDNSTDMAINMDPSNAMATSSTSASAAISTSADGNIPSTTSISQSSTHVSLAQVSSSSSSAMDMSAGIATGGAAATPSTDGVTNNTQSQSHAHAHSHTGGLLKQQQPTPMLNEELDDPGQDHAMPDDLTDDPNANIIWSPQNQQSTCEFTHTITNYSQKRESGCKKAEYSNTTIDSCGNRWRLIVYVNGNGRASNHHLSLFLQVADADDLPFGWKKAVSYVLTLEHSNGQSLGYAKRNPDKTFKLCPKAIDWGWSQFITSDRIQQDGYITDDSLVVRASVTVKCSSISIDPEDAELYLKCAVEEGNAEAVEACLAQGASVNCQFKDDLYTPLHTACSSSASNGSLDVLNLLLKRGADGNACNKWRETPLLIAANNGHKAAVEALLKSGADPSMCSEAGWSALTFAAHKGYDEIVSLLLNAGAPVNCRVIEDLSTPLHKACAGGKDGHLSAVTQLLTGGADVHALNKWRETPLLTAANHGQASAVEALLDAGADPCRCTDTGWSPLSIAAYKGHDDVVELLLEQGAPTEEADPTLSALLQAATKGLPNTVELLLRHGADHTVTTKKGDTALSILVEQNLIDAAVEMVTEYKASIPRCSRDRKKVQRARLLINLRIKQQKEGDYDDSDQDDSDEGARSALHDSANSPNSTTSTVSKKKKKKKKGMNAEQKAKAAEEALLLELEQEDVKAQKEEAAATSKRNKKKKKKERERQVKLEQEKVRREKEEKAIQERENQRKLKEENDRKLRAAKAKEQKELEMKEALERQKKAAARQKEKELKEKKRQQILEQEKRDAEKKELLRREKEQETLLAQPKEEPTLQHADDPSKSKRGWETASGAESNSVKENTAQNSAKGTVEDQLENMANGVVGFLGFNPAMSKPAANSTPGSMMTEVSSETMDQPVPTMPQQAEPAPVSLLREEKVAELLQRTTAHLSSIDNSVVKTVLYKWIVRASSESMPFLDPVIPSWTDFDYLVSFLQRQLIAESRKASNGIASNIEMMKEAGSFLAKLCVSLAREVVEYRDKCSEVFPEMSDLNLKMNAHAVVINNGSNMVVVEWDARSKIFIPRALFEQLSDRYNGASTLLLNSMFALMKRYETMNYILGGTGLDYRLPQSTLSTVAKELKVEMELWTDPISVFGKNKFCGIFPDVDVLFGGLRPFIEQSSALEMLLAKEGGSVSVLSPSDDRTASFFMKRILNILEGTDGKGVPVSFTVFLPMRAFRDLKQSPSAENLSFLDARLLQSHRHFIRHFETLNPGQHNFVHGSIDGQLNTCNTGSLMLILQNDSGRTQFPINEQSVANIVHSLSMTTFMPPVETFTSFGAESVPNSRGSSIPSSPVGLQHTLNGFEGMSNTNTNANTNNGSRRGRFVELVQDGEDDFANAEEMVSGMLSSLDISMFQENPSQDVDIEAISLMGIGNPDLVNPRRKTSGRFG